MPRDDFVARPADALSLRLARNEWESLQLVVVPNDAAGLCRVRVTVSDLKSPDGGIFASSNVQSEVVGYVRNSRPCYPVKALGWWPDPLLGFMEDVDVAGDDAQSFYLRVRCPKAQQAGKMSLSGSTLTGSSQEPASFSKDAVI